MGALKALGNDGLHAPFFKSQWDTICRIVCNFVKGAYLYLEKLDRVNKMLLVLIPKVDNNKELNDFYPISLCNVVYKVIMKIVTIKLKEFTDFLIGLN